MAIESPITRAMGWFRFERKQLRVTVFEADGETLVDLSTIAAGGLVWRLLRQRGSAMVYLSKSTLDGITVTGDGNEVAVITIDDDEYETLPAGTWYHELWDRDNEVLLAFGDAVLSEASAP